MEPGNGVNGTIGNPAGGDRRQRQEDVWARALRSIVNFTYILLFVNLLIFLGIASREYNRANRAKIAAAAQAQAAAGGASVVQQDAALPADQAEPEPMDRSAYLRVYLPILGAGLVVGVAGIFIHRKRTRRRSDRHYQGQLLCIVLSVVGLLLYFILV